MRLRSRRIRLLAISVAAGLAVPTAVMAGSGGSALGQARNAHLTYPSAKQLSKANHEAEGKGYLKARERYLESRYLAGTKELSPERASMYRAAAARKAWRIQHPSGTSGTSGLAATAFTSAPAEPSWSPIGPTPIFQIGRTTGFEGGGQDVSGRVAALAVASDGTIYSGSAGGGVWRYDPDTELWTALTDDLPTLAVGAITIAPSDENIVYLATGEGDLSGDSYYGDGIWRSTDRGDTWTHVSGNQFPATSVTRLLVAPKHPNVVYVATIRGRGGSRRVSPPTDQTWGVYKSTDGGSSWTLLKGTTNPDHGATDLELDPNHPGRLFATFWNQGIYRSGDNGQGWKPLTYRLPITPKPDFSTTRFSIATADLGKKTRIYAGFDWLNAGTGVHRSSRLFRSDDGGLHWQQLPYGTPGDVDSVLNYCDIQCTYDNVVEVDPTHPNIVYAAGEYDYSFELGGIYRSLDGGMTWKTLGVDLHPDFHALAFQPGKPNHIVIGNDGGVWDSFTRGGRHGTGDLAHDLPQWNDINSSLSTAQFTSIDYGSAAHPDRFWGGTQDNGTQIAPGGPTWYDVTSGDGGQVVVDHTNDDFVFGTYYNLTGLYRFQDGGDFFTNANIMNGIDLDDRSEFYIPLVQDQGNTNQLLTGTQRVYRTDNAETPVASDVEWQPISADLTSGCEGSASNGGRACVISALGVADGGAGAYAGTEEGWVWSAADAMTATGLADWQRNDSAGDVLPGRPVTSFAVDRSDWRTAFVSFAGYNAATPGHSGHVFATTDGGQTWTDVSGNLPDNPVNSLNLDPSDPNTVYAGSDVGSFVTHDGGDTWTVLGTGLPRASIWQQAYDPSRGLLVAGTHGRGAWTVDTGTVAPALVAQVSDPGVPVGPGSDIPYTITIRNVGNEAATGVTVTDPVPDHTTVKSTDGNEAGGNVTWTVPNIDAGDSVELHLTVTIDAGLDSSVHEIVNDGLTATTTEGPSTHGSPHVNPIAAHFSVAVSPATELRTAQLDKAAHFTYTLTNTGYGAESFDLAVDGNAWATDILPGCSTSGSSTATLDPGETEKICVNVTVPHDAAAQDSDTFSLTASPHQSADPADDVAVEGTTIAVVNPVLLVDNDGDAPDVQDAYKAALDAAHVHYDVWDLTADSDLQNGYLNGYDEVYWFTGTSWPAPLAPYYKGLITYLDSGGKLFMSGMDALDQSEGNTPFAASYLHIDWNDTDDNDQHTDAVHAIGGTPIGGPAADYPLTLLDGFCDCNDVTQPTGPAQAQFNDDNGDPDGVAVSTTSPATGTPYKAVFLAFPLEEMGQASDQAALVTRVESYFH